MEFNTWSNLLIALLIFALIAEIYAVFSLKSLYRALVRANYELYFQLTARSDLIPFFVEHLGKYFDRGGFKALIEARAASMKVRQAGKEKADCEKRVWEVFAGLRQVAERNPEVNKDVHLIALKTDLEKAGVEINTAKEVYNRLAARYLRLRSFPVVKPFAGLLKMGEFELLPDSI